MIISQIISMTRVTGIDSEVESQRLSREEVACLEAELKGGSRE